MKILVLNSGSSSLKYTLFEMDNETIIIQGLVDKIGLEGSFHSYELSAEKNEQVKELVIRNHGDALDEVFSTLAAGILGNLNELAAVAHRVAHGGRYKEAIVIDDAVMLEIRDMIPFVPLHHPAMILEIQECMQRMPDVHNIAVFDTSFHRTIPDYAAIYGLPYECFREKGYRRTGFHGHSHQYITKKAADFYNIPISDLKIISCHLGNGGSITAVEGGKSIDTTLGMTALEGLIMGTRSGDVDPGLIPVLMKDKKFSPDELLDFLYKKCGMLGISGISRDLREIEAAAQEGNGQAVLALEAYAYKTKRYIGAMLGVLGGCDILIFAGGVGRNSSTIREMSLKGLENLGIILDKEKNRIRSEDVVFEISHTDSKVKIVTVQTFEELMMARECLEVIDQL